MRIVVALGGNALLQRGDRPDAGIQLTHIHAVAVSLATLATNHELLICHGNGPQIGMLALESETDMSLTRPYPLDVLVAQTQGMIGYWLAQSLRNAGVMKPIVSLITQTMVDGRDVAFERPTKFIGAVYSELRARELAEQRNWSIARDGMNWRRVVPSPLPLSIVEQGSITGLMDAQSVVICGGGGGAPVIDDGTGHLVGSEAVVDKDRTAALLAQNIGADRLLILTDVSAVMANFGTPQSSEIRQLDVDSASRMQFVDGSMGPKIEACVNFVRATGHSAAIGSLTDAFAVFEGSAGTRVTLTSELSQI